MKLATQITLGFLIAISIDSVDSFVNYTLTLRVKRDSDFLNRSEGVIRNSGTLNKGIITMQSAFRGYLLTGDEHFLDPFAAGLRTMPALLAQEKQLVSLRAQRGILDSIGMLHQVWVEFARAAIVEKRKAMGNREADKAYIASFGARVADKVGKNYNDRIEEMFDRFDEIEYGVREARRRSLAESINRTDRYSLMFSILLVLISGAIAVYLVHKISGRIDTLVRMAERISSGVFGKVPDNKRDELSGLSVSLNAMSDKLSGNISDLEKRNAELDQFAYVVSHDLKAPIRGISNVVQWIEEDLSGEVSPEMRKYLDYIPERIGRLEKLIDGLLEYARISRDASVKEEVDVDRMIRDLAELIVPVGYRFITLGLPVLTTERLPLQQVFSNLISNAVKYNRGEGAEVMISCMDLGDVYEFSVRDNGPGIDPAFHEKVFVIFQTLREKNDKESTGIGLALVKKIVEDKGGRIWIVSTPGDGADFLFTWPK